MISALFLIAGIHSTTNLKTYKQAKNFFKETNTHSLHVNYPLTKNVMRLLVCVPFHYVQYANTEFMS